MCVCVCVCVCLCKVSTDFPFKIAYTQPMLIQYTRKHVIFIFNVCVYYF